MDIEGTIKKINMMNDNKERFRLFCELQQYLYLLPEIKMLSTDDVINISKQINDLKALEEKYDAMQNKVFNDIANNLQYFNKIYRSILVNADKYPLFSMHYPYYNLKRLINYAIEFFKLMGNDVYELYKRLQNKELILEKDQTSYGGLCWNINGHLSSIILYTNSTNLYKIIALVHEMGHAYDNYLNRTHDYKLDVQINSEITSITFEHLFIKFLMNEKLLKEEDAKIIYHNFFTQHIKLMHEAYIYNNLVMNNIIWPGKNFLIIEEKDKTIIKKYNIMKNNMLSKDIQSIKAVSNEYAIGTLVSFIMMNHYTQNKIDAIKEIKDLSMFSPVSNTEDILNLITKLGSIDIINKNTYKILIKNKKHLSA